MFVFYLGWDEAKFALPDSAKVEENGQVPIKRIAAPACEK